VIVARPTAWLACLVMLLVTAGVHAQATKPAPPPAVKGRFEGETLNRATGSAAKGESATTKAAAPSTGIETFRVIAALALVIVVIFLLRWIAQQFFGLPSARKSSRAVQVLGRSIISPKQQVLLLQVGKRVIVVGDCGGQMNALAQITDPDEIAELSGKVQEDKAASTTKSFGNIFGKAQTKFDEAEEAPKQMSTSSDDVDPALATTQAELSGLMDKVRSVAAGMKKPS
jgi:flagellar biogenesis protein FliO